MKNKKYEIRTLEERIISTKNNCQKQIESSYAEAKDYVAKEVDSWSKQFEDVQEQKLRLETEIKDILKRVTIRVIVRLRIIRRKQSMNWSCCKKAGFIRRNRERQK